jgi:ATP-binding cassette subfamily C protein
LEVTPGSLLAITGPSGAGKTTLVRLMLGFDTPSSGLVLYDDVPLQDYDLSSLRRQFGVVLQGSGLLTSDVFTNIAANRVVTMAQAWDAAKKAGIAEEIKAMSLQMKTFVGENGGMLSGGQRQRILIARALVNAPRALFLDEATSALDNRTQREIMRCVKAQKVTTVVIAHRLSTIQDADHILFLDGGALVESGTYDELIALDGRFAAMARRQLY